MSNFNNSKIGKKFGNYTVISFYDNQSGRARWLCKCICGKEKPIHSTNLLRAKGCGCHRILPKEQALSNLVFYDYRCRARKKKLEFTLTKEDIRKLISDKCYYCRSNPNNFKSKKLYYNGIDRIDNKKGYTLENSRTCCSICNIMKMELNEYEFKEHIKNIYNNYVISDNH